MTPETQRTARAAEPATCCWKAVVLVWMVLVAVQAGANDGVNCDEGRHGGGRACGDRVCGQPHPEAPEELAEFAFLIGRWNCDVRYLNPDWKTYSEGQGSWTAYYMMDGHAIQDDFRGAFAKGYIATTFRAYNVREGRWNGYWLDGRGGVWSRPLIEQDVGTGVALRTQIEALDPEGNPAELELQYHFYDVAEDAFRWRQSVSLDEGETWVEDTMLIDCKRVESNVEAKSVS